MKRLLYSLIGIIGIFLLSNCAKDQENLSGTISGLVTDYTNANTPIAGATVTLNTKGLTKTTGSDGRFEFVSLEPGTYTIQVEANNYQATTKQVTVYAGQTANCDFQLSKGAVNVDLSPITLNFGNTTEQLSFTITNNSTGKLNYTISNIPDFVQVSPTTGSVAARGIQAVTVSVVNRTNITTARNGQMTVNIGNDSYTISVNVGPYKQESVSVDIHPSTLYFDKDTEQLAFTMTSNYSKDLQYTISSSLDILKVSPYEGTLKANGQQAISVTVIERQKVNELRKGQLTISIGGNTYVVDVNVAKAEDKTESDDLSKVVPNGLYAFYTFEDSYTDVTSRELTGVGVGTSFTESFNGTKAMNISAKPESKFTIPDALIDQNQMSVSFWVKDLYDGQVFQAIPSSSSYPAAFVLAIQNGHLKFVSNPYNISYKWNDSPSFTHNSIDGWHMITLVSDNGNLTIYTKTTYLYVDGVYTDVVTESSGNTYDVHNECTKFIMGGSLILSGNYAPKINAPNLIIDNLRFYKNRMLSEDEVKEIYNKEKK